jgi:hypothetical protein
MANVQVTINQTGLGKNIKNVTNWEFPDFQASTIQGFADALRTSYVTHAVDMFNAQWELQNITVRQYDGGPAFSQDVPFTAGALQGNGGGGPCASQTCLLVSTQYLGGKPNRGRLYFGLMNQSDMSAGQWGAGARGEAEALVANWIAGIDTGAGNAFLRIARVNEAGNIWTLNNPAETAVADSIPRSQRSRQLDKGE